MDKRDFQEMLEQALISAAVITIIFLVNAKMDTSKESMTQQKKTKIEHVDSIARDSVSKKLDWVGYRTISNNVKSR